MDERTLIEILPLYFFIRKDIDDANFWNFEAEIKKSLWNQFSVHQISIASEGDMLLSACLIHLQSFIEMSSTYFSYMRLCELIISEIILFEFSFRINSHISMKVGVSCNLTAKPSKITITS